MSTRRAPAILAIVLLALPGRASSQGASLAGVVLDTLSGEPLEGAQIVVQGTALSSLTDVRGWFAIESITPGEYNLSIRRIGYSATEISSVRLAPGQHAEIRAYLRPVSLDAPATRADSCTLAQRLHNQRAAREADFLEGHMADFTRYLELPPLGDASAGSELRLWEAWGSRLDNHALRIRWADGTIVADLYRWWPRYPGPPHETYPAELAAAHERAGVCGDLWKDGEYYFCRVHLANADLPQALSGDFAQFERAAVRSSLPPAQAGDCAVGLLTIVLYHAHYTALELLDGSGYRWYGLFTPMGAWPTSELAGGLAEAFHQLQNRYWIALN